MKKLFALMLVFSFALVSVGCDKPEPVVDPVTEPATDPATTDPAPTDPAPPASPDETTPPAESEGS